MATKQDSKAAIARRAKADAKRHELEAYATLMRCVKAPSAFSPVSIRQAFSYLPTLSEVRSILEEVPGMTLTAKVPDGLKGKDATAFSREALVQRFIEWAVAGGPDLTATKAKPASKGGAKVKKMTAAEGWEAFSQLIRPAVGESFGVVVWEDGYNPDRSAFVEALSALTVGKSDVEASLRGICFDLSLMTTGVKGLLIDRILKFYGFAPVLAPTNTPMMDADTLIDEARKLSWGDAARLKAVLAEMEAEALRDAAEVESQSSALTETALETAAA